MFGDILSCPQQPVLCLTAPSLGSSLSFCLKTLELPQFAPRSKAKESRSNSKRFKFAETAIQRPCCIKIEIFYVSWHLTSVTTPDTDFRNPHPRKPANFPANFALSRSCRMLVRGTVAKESPCLRDMPSLVRQPKTARFLASRESRLVETRTLRISLDWDLIRSECMAG